MSFIRKIKAGLRTVAASTRSCPGWERYVAMLYYNESAFRKAAQVGLLPEGTLEYAAEIIALKIQGKTVAKTRYQWARFEWGSESVKFRSPYRSYDSEKTVGVNTHAALTDLVSLNKANPNLSLDELKTLICHKYFWGFVPY